MDILKALDDSVKSLCEEEDRVGILFSGGVDSTLVGTLASKHCEAVAYAVGTEDSRDLHYINKNKFPFEVNVIDIGDSDLTNGLKKVMSATGTPNPVRVGAGFPPYLASKVATKDGIKVMLPGQGADEIFGGYWRYMKVMSEGYDKLSELLSADTKELADELIKSDKTTCELNGIELRTPFLTPEFIKSGLSIPLEEKIKKVAKGHKGADEFEGAWYVRKYALKKAAEQAGVPDDIVWRPKKAAQYGSGIHKALERIAKEKGFMEEAKKLGHRGALTLYLESEF